MRDQKVPKRPRLIKQEPTKPAHVPCLQSTESTSDDEVIFVDREDRDSSDEWYVDMPVSDVKNLLECSVKATPACARYVQSVTTSATEGTIKPPAPGATLVADKR